MDILVHSKTLQDQAYNTILDAICDGTLEPGERLTQENVARRLNVSRQPITSALNMLKAQGFVEDTGRRGVVVAPLDRGLFDAIYEFRSAIEPLAVRLAIANLQKGDIELGQEIIVRGTQMALQRDIKGLLQADVDFHSFIYELADNILISNTMKLNWQHLRRSMKEVLRHPDFIDAVWREHSAILNAMAKGDAAKAVELIHDHVDNARKHVAPLLEAKG